MAYKDIVDMAGSQSLTSRIVAAAAQESVDEPLAWVQSRIWKFAASPGWADAWAYANGTATVNNNPDTGVRDDVISDAMILSAVQSVAAQP